MPDRSAWDAQFGTGLRTSYDFTIYAATFGTDLAYNNGETYLLLLSGVDEDGVEASEMLSLGEGWESKDGGFTVAHEKKAIVNKNSAYGKWCAYAADAMAETKNTYLWDKNPLEAAIWTNTKWHMEEKVIGEAYTDRKTGKDIPERTRLMPTAFLGFDAEAGNSPAPAPVADKAAELLARAKAGQNGATAPVSGLVQIAKDSPDFSAFVNSALQLPEVVTDEKLAESVIDSGPTGYYALNH